MNKCRTFSPRKAAFLLLAYCAIPIAALSIVSGEVFAYLWIGSVSVWGLHFLFLRMYSLFPTCIGNGFVQLERVSIEFAEALEKLLAERKQAIHEVQAANPNDPMAVFREISKTKN